MNSKYQAKKRMWILLLIVCLILLSMAGCGRTKNSDKTLDNTMTLDNQDKEDIQTDQDSEENDKKDENENTEEEKESNNSQEVECNWTLSVNDTISTKLNGYDFECTLQINATKDGGIEETGTYTGEVSLTYEYKMENQGVKGNAVGSGQDSAVVFELITYDDSKKDDLLPLAQLVEYDVMATGNFNLIGTGISNESAGGGSWSKEESKATEMPFKIAVDGGQVDVELPSLVPGIYFKGMLTGTPK